MTGEIGSQFFVDADGAHAGATTAVGDGEGLVQVQVADIRTDTSRAGEADLSIHVGSIHVDEATMSVDGLDDFEDVLLENAESRGIGDHQAREIGLMFHAFGLEILKIDVSFFFSFDDHDFHAGHHGRGWIGAVGT